MELSQEDLSKIQQKLRIGTCPNCGYNGDKELSTHVIHLTSYDVDQAQTFDLSTIKTLPAVMSTCPRCGYISLFNKNHLFKRI